MIATLNTRASQRRWALGLGVLVLATLAACSSGPKAPQPAPLVPVTALVPARPAWQAQVGVVPALLAPTVRGDRLALANAAGAVVVFDASAGRELWRVAAAKGVSAGVGFDGQTAAVVGQDNELVSVGEGRVLWRQRLPARVFTAPLVAGGRVFVLAGDRSVSAYDGRTGHKLWSQAARSGEPLVLQQGGVLTAVGDTLVAGVAGRLVGFNPLNGSVRWDTPIASPRGVNEIERLVDLVGGVGRVDEQLCVRAFQATVACVDAGRGALVWSKGAQGGVGLGADRDQVYGSESNGRVVAWRRAAGEVAWSTDALQHRGLTAPLAAGRSIVVGDAQGFVHLLSRDDGAPLNRLVTDGSAIVAAPVLAGNTLVAVTRNGGVFAWRPE